MSGAHEIISSKGKVFYPEMPGREAAIQVQKLTFWGFLSDLRGTNVSV
jgi:hypothetical protein